MKGEGQSQLLQIIHAGDALGLGLGFGERGQEQAGEDGNDGDDDEQLDERERGARCGAGLRSHDAC